MTFNAAAIADVVLGLSTFIVMALIYGAIRIFIWHRNRRIGQTLD